MIPEILAPAGNYEAFLAAIENGADAVYLGGPEFNARYHADNFTDSDIARAIEYAHLRGRKVYITLNVLLDDDELLRALDYIFMLQELGIDAVIVQDMGLLNAITRVFKDLRVHASTQMTVCNSEGVRMVTELGVCRVVLARELGAGDISLIRNQCPGVELEVFVHGALCYSYSGQCLLSSVVGGRSGNRGRCAQPCRLIYRLLEEGVQMSSGYLLSPADLCLLSELPELVSMGVASLKIEGRMKRPEYVAVVTRVYRQAMDRLQEYQEDGRLDKWAPTRQENEDLNGIFNRTFTINQWLGKNIEVLRTDRPNNRGVLVGQVVKQYPDEQRVDVKLERGLYCGDGIEIWTRYGTNPIAVVENIHVNQQRVEKARPGDIINIEVKGRCCSGDPVYRTHDRMLIDKARETIVANREENRVPIWIQVKARTGEKMQLSFSDGQGHTGTAMTQKPVEAAQNRPLTKAEMVDKLNRLGNTPWKPQSWDIDMEPDIMIPFSELNEARRMAGNELKEKILSAAKPPSISREVFESRKYQVFGESEFSSVRTSVVSTRKNDPRHPARLSIRVGCIRAARAALESGADRVYLSLSGLNGSACSVDELDKLKDLARGADRELYFEVPAILRSGDELDFSNIREQSPDGILIGNPGALYRFRGLGIDIQADYTFNTFNSETIKALVQQGVKGVCLSPELNRVGLRRIVASHVPLEYIVHGQLMVMVSEHCVMGNLGQCSGECHQRERVLMDAKGYKFPVFTDRYCRMHLFNSRTTCLVEELEELERMGIRLFRIEALLDTVDMVRQTVNIYREALDRIYKAQNPELSGLRARLETVAKSPLTRLHLKRGVQ